MDAVIRPTRVRFRRIWLARRGFGGRCVDSGRGGMVAPNFHREVRPRVILVQSRSLHHQIEGPPFACASKGEAFVGILVLDNPLNEAPSFLKVRFRKIRGTLARGACEPSDFPIPALNRNRTDNGSGWHWKGANGGNGTWRWSRTPPVNVHYIGTITAGDIRIRSFLRLPAPE